MMPDIHPMMNVEFFVNKIIFELSFLYAVLPEPGRTLPLKTDCNAESSRLPEDLPCIYQSAQSLRNRNWNKSGYTDISLSLAEKDSVDTLESALA
jgi:hypothetical protein